MKIYTQFILLVLFCISCNTSEKSNTSKPHLPERLAQISTGIEVRHNKNIVYAERNSDDPKKHGLYVWKYETAIKNLRKEPLKVVEFGAYLLIDGKWTFKSIYKRPFNAQEFEDWYHCPKAILRPGATYIDNKNWSKGNQLSGHETRSLWYYIAEDNNGKKYKGIQEIITVGSLSK